MCDVREKAESILEGLDIKVLVELRDILNNDEMYSILIDDYDNSTIYDEDLLTGI